MEAAAHIQDKLDTLGILASDVSLRFVRGSGTGGQKINKTSSTVVLTHRPSGIEVRVQEGRSQTANRARAWELLLAKIEAVSQAAQRKARAEVEKAKRRNRPRSPGQKRRMVESKRRRRDAKASRGRVSGE